MNTNDIIITKGIIKCRNLGGAYTESVKFLYVALSPEARRRLKGIFSQKELDILDILVEESMSV